jgi:hypothetical protein
MVPADIAPAAAFDARGRKKRSPAFTPGLALLYPTCRAQGYGVHVALRVSPEYVWYALIMT